MKKNNISSSYKKENFDLVFKDICKDLKPKSILEIGILDGYSLSSFVRHTENTTNITAIDLFEDYEFKNSEFLEILNKFKNFKNVNIEKGDFYKFHKLNYKFDLIHIDISNDGDVYDYALKNYLPQANKALLLEGGSVERDNVEWMVKYNKPKINDFLNNLSGKIKFEIIEAFPSLTIIYK